VRWGESNPTVTLQSALEARFEFYRRRLQSIDAAESRERQKPSYERQSSVASLLYLEKQKCRLVMAELTALRAHNDVCA
jgi:hypothetical protein